MIWARTYLQDNIISTGRNMSDEEINQLAEKLQIPGVELVYET
jgi:hypothetical protein